MNSTDTNKAEMRTCIKRNPRKPGRIKGLRGIVHMNGDAPSPPKTDKFRLVSFYFLPIHYSLKPKVYLYKP